MLASPFGYASLEHIDYPTLILGKSCKLIPVVVMNFLLYRKHYPIYKYISVFLVTVGVSGFMLLQPVKHGKGATTNSLWGLMLLTMNLVLDGATNSTQDRIFHQYRVSGQHMMLFMNLFTTLATLTYFMLPWSDEWGEALNFFQNHPSVIVDVLVFAGCGALGQIFIFHALERYGSVSLVTVTVTRKIFTMLLSVFWFGHQLVIMQWVFVALVFFGIGVDAHMKSRDMRQRIKVLEVKTQERIKGEGKKREKKKKKKNEEADEEVELERINGTIKEKKQ